MWNSRLTLCGRVAVQMRYMLGDSGRSLIAGWGKNPPTHIQNRAASCPNPPEPCTPVRAVSYPFAPCRGSHTV